MNFLPGVKFLDTITRRIVAAAEYSPSFGCCNQPSVLAEEEANRLSIAKN
jgi:hypothetical protein